MKDTPLGEFTWWTVLCKLQIYFRNAQNAAESTKWQSYGAIVYVFGVEGIHSFPRKKVTYAEILVPTHIGKQ